MNLNGIKKTHVVIYNHTKIYIHPIDKYITRNGIDGRNRIQ